MSVYGIPSVKPVTVQDTDRFHAPRPVFQSPTNPNSLEAISKKTKDNTPSSSLASQASVAVNEKIKSALLAASQAAKTTIPETRATIRKRSKESQNVTFTQVVQEDPQFGPEDVCDDSTFVRKTIRGELHTNEYKRLFWANGGEKHLVGGLTYAQAFCNLRNEKLRILRQNKEVK